MTQLSQIRYYWPQNGVSRKEKWIKLKEIQVFWIQMVSCVFQLLFNFFWDHVGCLQNGGLWFSSSSHAQPTEPEGSQCDRYGFVYASVGSQSMGLHLGLDHPYWKLLGKVPDVALACACWHPLISGMAWGLAQAEDQCSCRPVPAPCSNQAQPYGWEQCCASGLGQEDNPCLFIGTQLPVLDKEKAKNCLLHQKILYQ